VAHALARNKSRGEVITPIEHKERLAPLLPGYNFSRIFVHALPDTTRLPDSSRAAVGFLPPAVLDTLKIDVELLRELKDGAKESPIAVAYVQDTPVAFCYAGAVTETLWDISIDTLPAFRRKGYAGLCAAFMIRYMAKRDKRPVWQAVEQNPASWKLAEKLGFVRVDELALFEPTAR
jgi:RimJ/RimL family protein N-acetyltransferase